MQMHDATSHEGHSEAQYITVRETDLDYLVPHAAAIAAWQRCGVLRRKGYPKGCPKGWQQEHIGKKEVNPSSIHR